MRESELEPLAASDPLRLGRHTLQRRLGVGGMGVVFLADGPLGQVAVKMVRSELAEDAAFRTRFLRELQTCFRVSGVSTARLLDFDVAGERPWLATEFIDAPNLEQLVTRYGPLGFDAQLALAVGLAEALVSLHAVGIVHRDLKPSNVLCPPQGPKVIDFGIAAAADNTALTGANHIVGSPAWMSPERVADGLSVAAGDVFAWGAVLGYAATGRPPFEGVDGMHLLFQVAHAEPSIDYELLAPPLPAFVREALARNPEHRPDARQLLERLTTELPITEVDVDQEGAPPQDTTTLLTSAGLRDGWYPNDPHDPDDPAPTARRRWPSRRMTLGGAAILITGLTAAIIGLTSAGSGSNRAGGPQHLVRPIEFRLVIKQAQGDCAKLTNTGANDKLPDRAGTSCYELNAPALVVHMLSSIGSSDANGQGLITFDLQGPDVAAFAKLTERNVNHRLAIVVGHEVQSAPILQSAITGGEVQINGGFTHEEAALLVKQILGE